MEHISYDTVSEAVEGLKRRGFTMDFNLHENCLVCNDNILNVEDFESLKSTVLKVTATLPMKQSCMLLN